MKKTTLLFLFLLFTSFTFFAGTLYVETAANGGDDTNAGTAAAPKLTLSGAISAASAGDTIIIGPGIFTDHTLNVNKALTIQGHGREDTTFDGTGLGSVGFMSITASPVTVKNMTIQDYAITTGSSGNYGGTAIRVGAAQGSSSTGTPLTAIIIKNIKFYNNTNASTASLAGAVEIVRNTTSPNHNVDIEECLFYDNTSSGNGGALGIYDGTTIDLRNCVMVDNDAASFGGAINHEDVHADSGAGTLNVLNCTIWRNEAGGSSNWENSGGIRSDSDYDHLYVNIHKSILDKNTVHGSHTYNTDFMVGETYSNVTYDIDYSYIYYIYNSYVNWNVADNIDNFSYYGEGDVSGIPNTDKEMWLDDTTDYARGEISMANSTISWLGNGNYNAGASSGTSIDVNGVTRPQGTAIDIGAYEYRNTWDGSESTAWATAANWSLTTVPSATAAYNAPYITNQTNDPVISTDITIDNLLIENAGVLTIQKTGSLKLTEHLIQNGTLTMESDSDQYSSLIVQGNSYGEDVHESDGTVSSTHSGNITYKRWIADEDTSGGTGWDLIGSPVAGQSISSFVSANSNIADDDNQYAIGVFSNNGSTDTAAAMYSNYTSDGASSTVNVSAAGNFTAGQGYAMATDDTAADGSTTDFTGTIRTNDLIGVAIDDNTSGATNFGKWNLVANPFPSFINANDDADGSNNFITVNSSNLDSEFAYVYGYDGDGTYTYYNHATPGSAVYIAPGQGFFVASDDSGGNTISFTEVMQTHGDSDDFNSENDVLDDVFQVSLRLYHGEEEIEETRLYFEENLNLGLDIGYDAGAFYQDAALMTRLVEEDQGHGMAINAMSTEDMDDVVIPLEINQTAGQEFRINLHTLTIGEINIYLEDTELETLTLLNEEDFVMTPTSDLSDAGRFYVHLTADTLSNEEVNTSLLNAYKGVDNNYITIEGLATQATSTEVSLYNILGTKVMDATLDNTTNTQTISTNGFATGIYIIKLESGANQLTKKLIIK